MLVFLNQIIGGADILSGGERIAVELLKRWREFVDITVITPEEGLDLIKKEEGLSINYIILPTLPIIKKLPYLKSAFFKPLIIVNWFISTIRTCKKLPTINLIDNKIFSAGDFFCNTIPAFLLKIKNKDLVWIVCVFHIIDSPFRRKSRHHFLNNLVSFLIQRTSLFFIKRAADKILVLNEEVKSNLTAMGFEKNKIFVSGAGIDFSCIDAVTSNGSKIDACFMARLTPIKGIFDIPKMWQGVCNDKEDARLLLIGGGGFKHDVIRLQSLIHEYHLDKHIDMVGTKTGAEKYRLMKTCKIFVFPSYEEGFAISILEAMACKLVVVAWDLPVYRSIYKDTIITVPIGNIEMLAKKVLGLLKNEDLRNEISEKAYNFSKQYDWDLVAQKAYAKINN